MEQSLQNYYESQFDLFSHSGWKNLLEDLQTIKNSINELSTVNSPEDLWYKKGQLDILDLVLNRKSLCEKVYEELKNETNV